MVVLLHMCGMSISVGYSSQLRGGRSLKGCWEVGPKHDQRYLPIPRRPMTMCVDRRLLLSQSTMQCQSKWVKADVFTNLSQQTRAIRL
jgi:hypothetical protein